VGNDIDTAATSEIKLNQELMEIRGDRVEVVSKQRLVAFA
jgi:hypothetical protein